MSQYSKHELPIFPRGLQGALGNEKTRQRPPRLLKPKSSQVSWRGMWFTKTQAARDRSGTYLYDFQGYWKCQGPPETIVLGWGAACSLGLVPQFEQSFGISDWFRNSANEKSVSGNSMSGKSEPWQPKLWERRVQKLIEIGLINSWKSWIWNQYL